MPFSAIDIVVCMLLVLGIRTGFRLGLGEMLWPLGRWLVIVLVGVLACEPLGALLERLARLPGRSEVALAYVLSGLMLAAATVEAQKHFGDRLIARMPVGRVDHLLGGVAGAIARAALILAIMSLLHPVSGHAVDWSPVGGTVDEAVGELGLAIIGTLRRMVLDESWVGQTARQHFGALLIKAA